MPTRTAPSFTTVDDILNIMGITEDDALDEEMIDNLIGWASQYIEARTHRWWTAETQTRYYDYQDSAELLLDQELLSVTTLTNGDGTEISSADFFLYPLSGPPYQRISIDRSSSELFTYNTTPQRAISVAGEWGASSLAPKRIVNACQTLVISALNQWVESGLTSLTTEFASFNFERAETDLLKPILDNRRIVIG